jgi:serine/threonine-protein kinase
MIGHSIAHYRVTSLLGAGGMGEVYRATDSKLGRDVALKVLPAAFAQDAERMARFQREAQVLASLNHTNIASIYGIEESGGIRALVMELVEGPTLADRIAQGAITLDEALPIAKQVAEALEYAHERGIIHRDLKPANVKLRPDGAVKILDFGLAKALDESPAQQDISASPTLTIGATKAGMILGTAAYMSPEQARGRPVDKRSDIWSFGCVLFEMLSDKQCFPGETASDSMAAILAKEPDWDALPPGSPVRLLRRCLEKDPKRRLRDIGDAFVEAEPATPMEAVRTKSWRQPLVWALLLVALTSSIVALTLWTRFSSPSKMVARLVIPLPPNQELTDFPAISPDGRLVAYASRQGTEEPQLYLRDLNSFEANPVSGSSGARQPFFSPDGRWVGFFAHGQLLKTAVAGGSPTKLADAAAPMGGTWNEDDTIIFTSGFNSGLLRVPASGGTPESLTKPDGAGAGLGHAWPQALPGGRSVIFTMLGKGSNGTAVLWLETRRWEVVLPGWGGAVIGTSGHLFASDETAGIKAAPFDPARPARTTADSSVLSDVYYSEYDKKSWLAMSKTGTVVYALGSPAKRSLVWTDREGKVEPLSKEQARFSSVDLSPDGTKVVVKQSADLWIFDLPRGTRSRLTFEANGNGYTTAPVWSRDGTRVIFSSDAGGDFDIYSQAADGSRPAELLLKRPHDQFPNSFAPDGTLVFSEAHPSTGEDLWVLSPDGKASPLRVTPFNEDSAVFSPDGRWLAYPSDETGRYEIYVQAYPGGGKRIAVSTGGGVGPKWTRDGKELIYWTGDAVVAAALRPDGTFAASRRLFDRSSFFQVWGDTLDVSLDGRRFLMIRRDPGSVPRQLNVILNWSEELKQAAAAGKK